MTPLASTLASADGRFAELPLLRRTALLVDQFGRAMQAARRYRSTSQNPHTAVRLAFREIAG